MFELHEFKPDPTKLTIFKGAHIIDAAQNIDFIGNLWLHNNKICNISSEDKIDKNAIIINCKDLLICPGFVDIDVELFNVTKQSIENISAIAVESGITSLVLSPQSSVEAIALITYLTNKYSKLYIYASGALSNKGEIAEYGLMQQAGAIALGCSSIKDTTKLLQMMKYASDFKLLLYSTACDPYLAQSSDLVNDSLLANWMGLIGNSKEAELIGLERELRLAKMASLSYHANISCNESCELIQGKASCSTTILHLSFNENDIYDYNAVYKCFPPFREEANRLALIESLRAGRINYINSGHKGVGSKTQTEAFGITNMPNHAMSLLLPLALRLYHNQHISLYRIVEALTIAPAKVFQLKAGSLEYNDFIIIDPAEPYIFANNALQGRVKATFVNGEMIHKQN